jgi:hypothetical protein
MRKRRPSPAMLVACLALFVALSGGAYAATQLSANSVGSAQLRDSSVTLKKLSTNSVNASKVVRGSLLAKDFKAGQLPTGAVGSQGIQGLIGLTGLAGTTGSVGPTGATGSAGSQGPPGASGNGYDFTTATGSAGPTLSSAGTYFFVVEAVIDSGGSALTGLCSVSASSGGMPDVGYFTSAVNEPASAGINASITGMLVLTSSEVPATTQLNCANNSLATLTPLSVDWWVSPVGS